MEMQQHERQTTSAVKGKRTKRPRSSLTTSSTSTSSTTTAAEEEDMAHCLILLAQGHARTTHPLQESYDCKTCNRSFPSFQALGGHRASHKKPKLPPPADDCNHQPTDADAMGLSLQIACVPSSILSAPTNNANSRSTKVHACGICGAEFSSGQALGGHMRRHRSVTAAEVKPCSPPRKVLCLDLNLPADEQEEQQSPELVFGSNGNTLMFAPSLVDCRY